MPPIAFKPFFLMRLARIYPIFLLALLMYLAVTWEQSRRDPLAIGLNLLLVQSWVSPYPLSLNYPAWTLSVELFFYVLFPFIVYSFDRYPTRQLLVFTGVIWLISNLVQLYYTVSLRPPEGSLAHDVLIYLPALNLNGFLVGVFGGIVLVRHGKPLSQRFAVNALALAGCVVAPIALTLTLGREVNVGGTAPFLTLMMYILVTTRSRWWDWMAHKQAETLGQVSYAMCIFQVPLFLLFLKLATHQLRLSETALFYLYFAALMAFSYCIYFVYESPLRDWARRRIKRQPSQAERVPS